METGHVEAPSHLNDAQHLLKTLPVQPPAHPAKSVMDFVAEESENGMPHGEGVFFSRFMTGITWTMFAVALGALVWMTYAAGKEYLAH